MPAPNIVQGNLNRLRASIQIVSVPGLNISAAFLAPEGIDLAFEGQANQPLPSMTGIVNSPEPFQLARITAHLLKSQTFGNTWKARYEQNSLLGDIIVRTDSAALTPYNISNCSIVTVERMNFGGREPGWVIGLTGAYYINANLWG